MMTRAIIKAKPRITKTSPRIFSRMLRLLRSVVDFSLKYAASSAKSDIASVLIQKASSLNLSSLLRRCEPPARFQTSC
jgi:hypothetical protein